MADASNTAPARRQIRKVGVLGAGAMGSRIAAHFANAGLPVVLLDILPPNARPADHAARNAVASGAIAALKKSKPPAFFSPSLASLITIGNFEDDLPLLSDCDWVIEAVAGNLEIKRNLLLKAAPFRRADALFTTNTSGLPIAKIAEALPPEFRRNWFGAHFFNPPRYMRLLEIIPTPDSDPAAIAATARFAAVRLGKTIVMAHDTPNFVANRIGTFNLLNVIRIMQSQSLTIEEVDSLTGTAIGWPKTGTFRLGDLVGLDVLAHVADNFAAAGSDERLDVSVPEFIRKMLENKWFGDKAGHGFYKKSGPDNRLVLDWKSLEYHPALHPKIPALDLAKSIPDTADRIKMLLWSGAAKDKAAAFYWPVLTELFTYAANRIGQIADDIVAIDRAMITGFNWELGPFEMWDAVNIAETAARMRSLGQPIAANVEKLLASGHTRWYIDDPALPSGRRFFDPPSNTYLPVVLPDAARPLAVIKKSHGVVKKNPGASLIDIGDGVACIEFHSKMNTIGGDIVSFITQVLSPDSDAVANFEAFVITSDAANFSVGANLMQLLLSMQDEEWDEVSLAIRNFQRMTQAIKFSPRPVVAAPFGMCLGGGTEVCLHSALRQPHAELYMGLVETAVGLIPGGGGCKETTLRIIDNAAKISADGRADSVEIFDGLKSAFENIAMARVSTSALDALSLGYLSDTDSITMNRERLLTDAAARAISLARAGYVPPTPRSAIPAPGENALAMLKLGVYTLLQGKFISDHDAKIANHLAHILCGGSVPSGTPLSEQYLLDLELEAFLSLCGEKKTQERIAQTLKTGKPLRN
jgi:3-hydroxyacyl-CoA dehydrogenase